MDGYSFMGGWKNPAAHMKRDGKFMRHKKIMKYVIAGGKRYIGFNKETGKNIPVEKFKCSVKFNYALAIRVLENLDADIQHMEDWKVISLSEALEKISYAEPLDIDQMVDSMNVDFKLLIHRKKFLELEYLEIEREITDLYHAMEFYNLNIVNGFKLYKMMQERLIRRRKNKDETLKINYILSGGIKGLTSNQTKEKIEKLNHRQYQPRVLKELFES